MAAMSRVAFQSERPLGVSRLAGRRAGPAQADDSRPTRAYRSSEAVSRSSAACTIGMTLRQQDVMVIQLGNDETIAERPTDRPAGPHPVCRPITTCLRGYGGRPPSENSDHHSADQADHADGDEGR